MKKALPGLVVALVAAAYCVGRPGGLGEPRAKPLPTVTLVAVGDIMLARGVAQKIARQGADYPFAPTADLIRRADFAFFNLECTLASRASAIQKRFSFKADPALAAALARAGFDIACLANNHSLDCGRAGLEEPIAALRGAGISGIGAGRNAGEAAAPLMMESHGLRVAFLARTAFHSDGVIHREDAPDVAYLEPDRIAAEVAEAKRRADVVVVSLHWGSEYMPKANQAQRRMARRLIDAGASLVLGHHTHSIQEIERYRSGVIAYSLGNFVFDSPRECAKKSVILECVLGPEGVLSVRTHPMVIRDCRPVPTEQ